MIPLTDPKKKELLGLELIDNNKGTLFQVLWLNLLKKFSIIWCPILHRFVYFLKI